jgi:ABC-type nitrate/sulfonate/bicarbonate transport system substrate-binding protein
MKRLWTMANAAIIALFGLTATPAAAQGIGISYQPGLYWSLPFYIAMEKGWWREAGLEPRFSSFPSGAPQVAAAPSKSWDIGGTGTVPAILGAARVNLITVGIINDQSSINALLARPAEADALIRDPMSLKGKQILLTSNSTGEYAAIACLARWGLQPRDVQLVNLGPADVIAAFSRGTGALAGLWAPNMFTLESRTGARTVCTGKDGGVPIVTAIVARAEYAKENPRQVAAFLATIFRGLEWQKANPAEAFELMKRWYRQAGVDLEDRYLQKEIEIQPNFFLADQLRVFDRSAGASEMDKWFGGLGEYMKTTGTLRELPDTRAYITDEYLKMVRDDPQLRALASGR